MRVRMGGGGVRKAPVVAVRPSLYLGVALLQLIVCPAERKPGLHHACNALLQEKHEGELDVRDGCVPPVQTGNCATVEENRFRCLTVSHAIKQIGSYVSG